MAVFIKPLMIWTIIFCSTINVVIGAILLDFRVTPSVVKSRETTNVTIQCLVNEIPQFYGNQPRDYFYNERGERVLQQNGRSDEEKSGLALIRIIKHFQSEWQAIAQISRVAPTVAHKLDARIIGTDGVISDDPTRRSFLQVTWDMSTSDALGSYRCDAISLDSQQNATSELYFGSLSDAPDPLPILINNTTDGEEVIPGQRPKENLTESEKTNNTVDPGIGPGSDAIRLWPRGSYGLLQPQSGCPLGGGTTWESGWVRHHTESTDQNKDELSSETHLKEPVLENEDGNNFLTQHFCIKTRAIVSGPNWPNGSYCINKKGICPDNFREGYVRWDEEDAKTKHASGGSLPDGILDQSNKNISYCCRHDGPADVPIYLPNSDPFYLYRYGGKCQQVHRTILTNEFVLFDTENETNSDEFGTVHPDGTIDNIRLELCYYRSV